MARCPRIDHLVYSVPDLGAAVAELEQRLGVAATPGGRHAGQGTCNAVLGLGPTMYLEILGPDPEQPKPTQPRWLGVDDVDTPRIVTWVATGSPLQALAADAQHNGVPLGRVLHGGRKRPDGVEITWQVTDPRQVVADGLVPFFIDWGDTPHPAQSAAQGVQLTALRGEHPDVQEVRDMLGKLGLELPVRHGPAPALIAMLSTPLGTVELR
jgi:hypothetical protein